MVFSLFSVFDEKRQENKAKSHFLSKNVKKTHSFIRVFDIKMLQTFILNTFAGEKAIKPMVFDVLVSLEPPGAPRGSLGFFWLAGCWLAGCLAGWLLAALLAAGWPAGWLAAWLAGCWLLHVRVRYKCQIQRSD